MGEDEPKTLGGCPTKEDTLTNGIEDVIKLVAEIEDILNISPEPEKENTTIASNKIEEKLNALSYIKRKLRKISNVVNKI